MWARPYSPHCEEQAEGHPSRFKLDVRCTIGQWLRFCMDTSPKMLSARSILFLACVALLTTGCGATSVSELSSPTAVRCQTSVAMPSGAVPAAGGTFTATVNAARECSWSAASDAAWIKLTPASGLGSTDLTIVAASNPQAVPRGASITVNDQRVAVSQEPMPCTYELDPPSVDVPGDGGRVAVAVRTADSCPWSAAEAESWLRLLRTSGTGTAAVEIEAEPNQGDARTGAVQIAGQSVTVRQARRPVVPVPAPAPTPSPSPAPTPPTVPNPTVPTPPPPAPLPPLPPEEEDDEADEEDDDKDKGKGGGRR
jgi:hypothetical protein